MYLAAALESFLGRYQPQKNGVMPQKAALEAILKLAALEKLSKSQILLTGLNLGLMPKPNMR